MALYPVQIHAYHESCCNTSETPSSNKKHFLSWVNKNGPEHGIVSTILCVVEWHLLRTQSKLLVEKDILLEVENKFHLINFFHTLRWENSFALPPYYYEDLVREFYANTKAKTKTTNIIWSIVRRKRIGITMKDINEAIDVPNEGLSVMYQKSFLPPEGTDWKVLNATDRFRVTYMLFRQTNTMILLTSSFTVVQRFVLYLIGTNVPPRASGTNEVSTSDLYFLDKMVHGLNGLIGIDYGIIIINHVWDFLRKKSKHAIPYPPFLSLISEKLGIDTSTATRTPIKESDKLHLATCGKIGINFDHLDGTSPPPNSSDEAETSQAPRASRTPSLLQCILASQEAILAELKNINKRLDESDARFAQMEAHFGIRPPSPPPDAPI
ncbi:hypothetical protein OROMI_006734 [Orobanche minor]